jgi:hypothetical protein
MAAHYAVVGQYHDPRAAILDVSALAALDAWRVTQTIYRFDTDVAKSLSTSPIDKIPHELLHHLPEWCVYIETPEDMSPADDRALGTVLNGFFAHLEFDVNTARTELRLLLDVTSKEGDVLLPMPIHLTRETLAECIDAAYEETNKQANGLAKDILPDATRSAAEVAPLLSLLLYLCANDPDIAGRKPDTPQPKKTKKGIRFFPAPRMSVREVGFNLGKKIRYAAETTDSGPAKAAHIRKAHWHLYWTGKGRTVPKIKWISPILVGDSDNLPVTIKKVSR